MIWNYFSWHAIISRATSSYNDGHHNVSKMTMLKREGKVSIILLHCRIMRVGYNWIVD